MDAKKSDKKDEVKGLNVFEMFEMNSDSAKKGHEIDFGRGMKVWVARAGGTNEKFQRYHEMRMRPYKVQQNAGTMDEKLARGILADCYAHAIVTGWEGVIGRDGQEITFSKQAVKDLLLELPELFNTIMNDSMDRNNFLLAGVDSDAKS
jgi:hypothetical protein